MVWIHQPVRSLRSIANEDLTIPQRRRPWKRRWIIVSASFLTISRLSRVVHLLKRREFMLELKRGSGAWVQIEMVEFIALPFPFPQQKLKNWSFHVAVVQAGKTKKFTKKAWCTCRVVVLLTKPIVFWRCRCCCRRNSVHKVPSDDLRLYRTMYMEIALFDQTRLRFGTISL